MRFRHPFEKVVLAVEKHQCLRRGDEARRRQLREQLHAIEEGGRAAEAEDPEEVPALGIGTGNREPTGAKLHAVVIVHVHGPAQTPESCRQPFVVVVAGPRHVADQEQQVRRCGHI